jgi:hypothetical protein
MPPASDEDLNARQAALQAEAADVLTTFDLPGPAHLTGSYVSGLMSWPDLDVMVHVGPGFTPHDVLGYLRHVVTRPDVLGFDYRDERGERSPTGTVRDERYHVPVFLTRNTRTWRVDLTLWLNDPHTNLTSWHENLRDTVTVDQRAAILRIKDVWHRLPSYPDEISGSEIYTAVLDDGVRTPEEFATWLTTHR